MRLHGEDRGSHREDDVRPPRDGECAGLEFAREELNSPPSGRRFLVQMAGSPGSGKSTLASLLEKALPAVVLDKDVVKSALLEAGIPEASAAPAAYEVSFALAEDLLEQGHSVLLDSPSYYPSIPEKGLAMARRHGVEYVFVECDCPVNVVRERIAARAPMPSQSGTATELPSARPVSGTVVVADTEGPAPAALSAVLAALGLQTLPVTDPP